MKKQLLNSDILDITNALSVIGYRKGNMKERWNLALNAEPFLRISELINKKQTELISEEGKENEKTGQKELNISNKHYQELMDCMTDVEYKPFSLEELQEASIHELVILKDVIVNE